jgi:hypothetical protein
VNLEWRSGSGAAHGLVWQFPGRAVTAKVWEADEHNVARYHSEPDIGEFASVHVRLQNGGASLGPIPRARGRVERGVITP